MKILFICHGNICRSTMAEFVMRNLLEQNSLDGEISVFSMATHTDEIGEPPYYETLRVLRENGLKDYQHKATQVQNADYDRYDLILCMDDEDMQTLGKIFAGKDMKKVKFLLEYSIQNKDKPLKHADLIIADPYYTRNFERCFYDVSRACKGLLAQILKSKP
ncbi:MULTISPECIES: low molecular weight protein-tyrosine-phosphatase [unclassified Campylobacter]|uniref:low molecular weight protein-tyrosine-phosphatase n=1 Tax=unclassified Campylobacter TaxID=2593542 RepID=UPI003D334CE6